MTPPARSCSTPCRPQPRPQLRELVAASGGNPLLLTCAPVLPGVAAADERLIALVARASEPARHALAGLALHGHPSCDDDYEELARLGLVVHSEERGWALRHDAFGQAALSLCSPREQIEIHRKLAATSATDGERARHYLHSGDPDQARVYALRAAQHASSRNERADHLAIAAVPVKGVEDPDILLDASEALALAGRVDDGLAFAQRAVPKDRVGVLRREKDIAWCGWWAAQQDVVWPALEAAMELLTPEDAEVEVTVRLLRARYLARVAWDAPAAIAEARAAVELAEREALPVAEAYGALGAACLVTGDPDWDQWLAKSIAAARHENLEAVEVTSADSLFVAQLVSGEPSECAPLARQMIDRTHALGSRSGEAQFRKNLLMARFHVDDALDETLLAARQLMAQPLNPRQRDHVEAHLVLACADLGLDEEIPAILANACGFTSHDMTSRSMILWAKAEADWLAGRAAEALRDRRPSAGRCPSAGFPSHVMVEPVRQFAALDLGLDPGARAERGPVPQPRRRQQGVAGDRRDVRAPGSVGELRPVPRRHQELGPHLAPQRGALRVGGRRSRAPGRRHRARDHDPAHVRAGAARRRTAADAAARRRQPARARPARPPRTTRKRSRP